MKNEEMCDDNYCDIDDENILEDEPDVNSDSETQEEFQKLIKKISQPS